MKNYEKPIADVSIVTANFNNSCFLDDFLNSIMNSTVQPKELIIVDDGSTDSSLILLNKYKYLPYLQLIKLNRNQGFSNALNIGIKNSSSAYIMRVDPDDIILPERIEIQYKYLSNHPDIDLIGSNMQYISTNKKVCFYSDVPLESERIYHAIKKGSIPMFNGTFMGKAEIFKSCPYNQAYVPAEDYDFISRLLIHSCTMKNLPQALTVYRMHEHNNSFNNLYDVYKKIAKLRSIYFTKNTSYLTVRQNYLHTKYYRLFLINNNKRIKYIYLLAAVLIKPTKLIKRLI